MTDLVYVLGFLFLLQIKHVFIDFVLQDMDQVRGKGIYGNFVGFTHSVDHALGTLLIVGVWYIASGRPVDVTLIAAISLIDLVTHYHIDWAKMNLGCRDMQTEKFWHHLGYDQFAHQVVYIFLTFLMFK